MAKVYDALRRAEEERKRKASGTSTRVAAVEWDPNPETAVRHSSVPFWKRWVSRLGRRNAPLDGSVEINKRRYALLQPDSYVAEQFRSLRGRIDSLASQRPIRVIGMASASAGDGKSTAAISLAGVTAMGVGRRVLLVDCDLRRPSIHRSLGLEPKAGLAEVLLDEATLDEALLKVEGLTLEVLAVRGQPGNPSELLASGRMRALIEEMSGRYDTIVLDTPACLGLPDAKTISELCDGLVMVVRADKTPREDIEAALEILDRRRVLGLVLNGTEQAKERYGYY